MKNMIKKEKNSIFGSIIFLLFGIILFTNPGGILKFISYITGGILILIGIINILGYNKTLKKLNVEETSKLISGVVLIILGLVVIIFSSFIETTIRLVFGAWIIYSGIMKLIDSLNIKNDKTTYYINLGVSILMIIVGFYVALTGLAYKMIGLFIMIYSILDIVSFISYKRTK
ncbi:MAG: hypothetical protein E7170_01280 [Firmicutes bacterium]|nr:hypothetical protein [Bacillota bacterium]